MRALIGVCLVLALVACQSLPNSSDAELIGAVNAELDRLERRGLAGQILIARGHETLLARPLGQVHPDRPERISMDSVMPLASVTKPFTASAVLALAADGRLSLDDPIGRHLEGLNADWHDLPLHLLLTHGSGMTAEIVNEAWDGHPRYEPITRDELIRRVNQFPPDHPPGRVSNYSNVGYTLIAAVVESVSDQSLESFLHQRLLAPVGIDDIGFLLPNWGPEDLVFGRNRRQVSGHLWLQPRLEDGLGWHTRGSGDLMARPDAMLAWWHTLRDRSWLPEPWMDAFLTDRVEQIDGTRYGFGLEFRQGPLGPEITHAGRDLDFSIVWTWFSDYDIMIYVALADSRWRADEINDRLARRLRSHLPLEP